MSMRVGFSPMKQNSFQINNKVSFGNVLVKGNHQELSLEGVKNLAGGSLPPETEEGLSKLLDGGKRVIKYMYVPSAGYTHQVVLGEPGLNMYQNPNRSWIYQANGASGEANGGGTTVLEALNDLIEECNKGRLSD